MMTNVNEVVEKISGQEGYSLEDCLVLNIVNSTNREERDIAVSVYREFLGQV